MSGSERRRHERIKVRIPCELKVAGKRAEGTIRDVSAGGLSLETSVPSEQGDCVTVQLQPKGGRKFDVQALVWTVRTLRNRLTKNTTTRLGLVLSEAPDEFCKLLESRSTPSITMATPSPVSKPASAATPPPKPAPIALGPPEAESRRFRVQVNQPASSRTRRILVFADSVEDARTKALAEAGPEWGVLDVVAA